MQFIDPDWGFALGTNRCVNAAGQCGGLYRTADGGHSWTALPALATATRGSSGGQSCPLGDASKQLCLTSISSTDAEHGVALGEATFFTTADGGQTWQQGPSLPSGHRLVQAARIGSSVLLLSYDGTRFQLDRWNGGDITVADTGIPGIPNRIFAVHGAVVLTTVSTGSIAVATTSDGATWKRLPDLVGTPGEISAESDGTLYAPCIACDGNVEAHALRPGATAWRALKGPPAEQGITSHAFKIADSTTIYSIQVSRRTNDGAYTDGVRYTRDGGSTWSEQWFSAPMPFIGDADGDPVSGTGILAAPRGSLGMIVLSTTVGGGWKGIVIPDGGSEQTSAEPSPTPQWVRTTITAQGLPSEFIPISEQFLDSSTGFVLGLGTCLGSSSGEGCAGLCRTDDGGSRWVAVKAASTSAGASPGGVDCPISGSVTGCLKSVSFTDRQHGALYGSGVIVTRDGGKTWTPIQGVPEDKEVRSVVTLGSTVLATVFEGTTAELLRSQNNARFETVWSSPSITPTELVGGGGRALATTVSATGDTRLMLTTDGVHWRSVAKPACDFLLLSALPNGTLVAACTGSRETPAGSVMLPGSTTWSTLRWPATLERADFGRLFIQLAAAQDSTHYAVLAQDTSVGASSSARWMITSDGGSSWRTVTSPDLFPSTEDGSRLLSAGDGVLSASLQIPGILVRSDDLAATWTGIAVG